MSLTKSAEPRKRRESVRLRPSSELKASISHAAQPETMRDPRGLRGFAHQPEMMTVEVVVGLMVETATGHDTEVTKIVTLIATGVITDDSPDRSRQSKQTDDP